MEKRLLLRAVEILIDLPNFRIVETDLLRRLDLRRLGKNDLVLQLVFVDVDLLQSCQNWEILELHKVWKH
jgi:hypothetical protein